MAVDWFLMEMDLLVDMAAQRTLCIENRHYTHDGGDGGVDNDDNDPMDKQFRLSHGLIFFICCMGVVLYASNGE